MKKINQYKLLAGICALSLFTACDFEELNTNPFEMTDEMGIRDGVAVGGAVTAMQRAVVTVGTHYTDWPATRCCYERPFRLRYSSGLRLISKSSLQMYDSKPDGHISVQSFRQHN